MAEKCNAECSDGSQCKAWAMDNSNRCRHHGGKTPTKDENPNVGASENNDNAVSHGMHQSAETFFANAEQHHLDAYYAYHESLCERWATQHNAFNEDGSPDVPYQPRKDLAEVAFDMAKLDMAKEYQAENAYDKSKPLTEEQEELTSEGVFRKEEVSKVESLKTDIRRENRLLLKDMGIYNSPEQMQAETNKSISEALTEALQD